MDKTYTKIRLNNKDFTVGELESILKDTQTLINSEHVLPAEETALEKILQSKLKGMILVPRPIMWNWQLDVTLHPHNVKTEEIMKRLMRDPQIVDSLAKRFQNMCRAEMENYILSEISHEEE